MSDDDKTGRHSWASKIPLISLLVFVFAAGGVFVEQRFMRSALADVATSLKESTAASTARLKALEDWRIAHEAISAPLMNDYIEDRKTRSERKKR